MYQYIWLALGLAVIAGIWISGDKLIKRHEAKQEALRTERARKHVRTWLEVIQAASDVDIASLQHTAGDRSPGYREGDLSNETAAEVRKAYEKIAEAKKRNAARAFGSNIRMRLDDVRAVLERSLLAIDQGHDLEIVLGLSNEKLAALVSQAIDELVDDSYAGSLEAIHDYVKTLGNRNMSYLCRKVGVNMPVFPNDWDEMIVRTYKSPPKGYFAHMRDESVGEAPLRVAEALRSNDIVLAKYLYACVNEGSGHWRKLIGDVLFAELSKFIEAYNAAYITPAVATNEST